MSRAFRRPVEPEIVDAWMGALWEPPAPGADFAESLVEPLVAQQRPGDRIVVVDGHSSDGTAAVAEQCGAEVTVPPTPPAGWLGKPNACWHGASITSESTLIFLDADVRPGATLLDDLAAEVRRDPNRLVSVQPWHEMPGAGEQASTLCNVAALMGCGAFTAAGRRFGATVAFGPVLAVDRDAYLDAGGHADPVVRSMHTEDIGLARAVGASSLFVGRRDGTRFRMYPGGLRELTRGWTRSLATGARCTPWWLAVLVAAWSASRAGGWIAEPVVYPLSAVQVWFLGRRAGSLHPVAAVLYPALVVVFVVVFIRSAVAVIFRRDVTWKGRRVEARPD